MEFVLYIVFFVSCLVLIVTVLLQPGKTDAGALFTSGISSAALNPRGTQSVLSKITIGAATIFMLSALMLSLPAITGDRSVLDSQGTEDKPAAGANSNANVNSKANAAPTANTNTASANVPVAKEVPANKEAPVEKPSDLKSQPAESEAGKQEKDK